MKKSADKLYDQTNYIDAVKFYEKLTDVKKPREDDLRRLSDCYIQLFEYRKAERCLKRLAELYPNAEISEADLVEYLQVLKYNGEYNEASAVVTRLYAKNNKSRIALDHMEHPGYPVVLKKDSGNYQVVNVDGINTANAELAPYFMKKGQAMTFSSNRRNVSAVNKKYARDDTYFMDLYQAEKQDSCHFYHVFNLPKKIITKYHDGPMVLSADEKTMYLTRNDAGTKAGKSGQAMNLKLFILTLDTLSGEWGDPVGFDYNSDAYSVGHPAVTRDGKCLYFVSDMPGGYGKTDLWMSRLSGGKWQKPVNLGAGINTEGREMFPFIHNDGTLFFATDGRAGLGGLDLYMASVGQSQSAEARNLGYPLNTSADDFGFYLDQDLLSGYLSSNRAGGKGKDDIYFFRSLKPLIPIVITGIVSDDNTGRMIPGTRLYLVNKSSGKTEDSAWVDAKGNYLFHPRTEMSPYEILADGRSEYQDKEVAVGDLRLGNNMVDIRLSPRYRMANRIVDAKTRLPLAGVTVTMIDKITKKELSYTTDAQGCFTTVLPGKNKGDALSYDFRFQKDGYVTSIEELDTKLDTSTMIHLNNEFDFKMLKIEKGIDLAKTINMAPIYFDVNRSAIRKDAARELDKIVALMNENKNIVIELGSHTDCRNSDAYNLKLSEQRAKASVAYIVSRGIDKKRIEGKGYGESKPVEGCACEGSRLPLCTEEQHQKNRRTEFVVVKF